MDRRLQSYRSEAYRLRAHPETQAPEVYEYSDERNSFFRFYLSIFPFLAAELFAEMMVETLPSGLVFPLGFLLFWAYYYTFYRPNVLEDQLRSTTDNFDIVSIPGILIGTAIWLVKKVTFEIFKWIYYSFVGPRGTVRVSGKGLRERRLPAGQALDRPVNWQTQNNNPQYNAAYHNVEKQLPKEILHALAILGLPQSADWPMIHKRYRTLAKMYHPDLNKEITDIGRRFMMFDSAYRRLQSAKHQYFRQ